MNTLTINHNNGHSSEYNLIPDVNKLPIAYKIKTPEKLINILEQIRQNRKRVKFNFGNIETGISWNEEHDTIGRIGLSKGNDARYPIVVYNSRSYGGGSLLTDCILKITEAAGGRVLYQADNFKESIFEIKPATEEGYTHSVYINGKLYSNHKSEKEAIRLINKLK